MNCKMCKKQIDIHNDPYFIAELETGYVILGWFQRFKGYTVFQCKEHGPELFDLEPNFRTKHLQEMTLVAQAVNNVFHPDKINYELLGNGCPHIHWHIYPRRKGDTPIVSSVYQLPNDVLFDKTTSPTDPERESLKAQIKAELMRLLSLT